MKSLVNCLFLLFPCALTNYVPTGSTGPIAQTCQGKVQGFTALNGTVDIFFGLPFAQAPVGQLRFEKPQRMSNWEGILAANETKPGCYSHATPDFVNALLQSGTPSEDCLYLNIFAPHRNVTRPTALLPVLVLIHGGGFEMGSALEYANYTDIGTNFVQHGILVVSIQYRLGQLGFASTGDAVLPGNLGLFDQVAALEWLVENVQQFGGDPGQVTLLGESAGAGSVSSLGLSPYSRDLFQGAVQMSGSALSSWVYGSRVANETLELATVLGCQTGSSQAIKDCLKAKNATELLQAVDQMGQARAEPNCIFFSARFDGDFFPEDPAKLIGQAPPKPTLIGFNQLEWLILTLMLGHNSSLSKQILPASTIGSYNGQDLFNYVQSQVAYAQRFGSANAQVAQTIFDFYTNSTGEGQQQKDNSTFYIYKYTKLISDLLITLPVVEEIQRKAANGWPVFAYLFNYVNEAGFPPGFPIKESFHINDLDYVFYSPTTVLFTFNEQDYKIQAFMLQAIRNFIKKGNPSTSSLKWPRVQANPSRLNHVEIVAPSPRVQSNASDFLQRLAFWNRLTVDHPEFNVMREIPAAAGSGY